MTITLAEILKKLETFEVNTPILVIAGDYAEYLDFVSEHRLNGKFWRYVDEQKKIMGMRGGYYILVGRWFVNPIMEKSPELLLAYDIKQIIDERITKRKNYGRNYNN